eukprot:5899788-Lingulodinium_polyedra.AAC.1
MALSHAFCGVCLLPALRGGNMTYLFNKLTGEKQPVPAGTKLKTNEQGWCYIIQPKEHGGTERIWVKNVLNLVAAKNEENEIYITNNSSNESSWQKNMLKTFIDYFPTFVSKAGMEPTRLCVHHFAIPRDGQQNYWDMRVFQELRDGENSPSAQEQLHLPISQRYASQWLGINMPSWSLYAQNFLLYPASAFGLSAKAAKHRQEPHAGPVMDFFAVSSQALLLVCIRCQQELKNESSRKEAVNFMNAFIEKGFSSVKLEWPIKLEELTAGDLVPPSAGDLTVCVENGKVNIGMLLNKCEAFKALFKRSWPH